MTSPRLSNLAATAAADAVCALPDNGFLKLYDGVQPETADTQVTTQETDLQRQMAEDEDLLLLLGVLDA